VNAHHGADAHVVTEAGQEAEHFEFKRDRGFVVEGGVDVVGEGRGLPHGELGELGIRLALRIGDGSAIADGPDFGAILASHGSFDDEMAVAILGKWQLRDDGGWENSGGEDDGFGFDDAILEMNAAGFDRFNRGLDENLNAEAPVEKANGVLGKRFGNFGHDAVAGLDEEQLHFIAADTGVVADDFIHEGGELTEDLSADKPPTDDDHGEEAPAGIGICFDIGALEAFDEVIAQDNYISEGFERESLIGTGDLAGVGDSAEGEDQLIIRDIVRSAFAAPAGVDDFFVEINAFDDPLDEAGSAEERAYGDGAVAEFEGAGAGLEHEGSHQEEIVAADEGDLDIGAIFAEAFEAAGGEDARETAAEDDNARGIGHESDLDEFY
jgi:hypothetical protein